MTGTGQLPHPPTAACREPTLRVGAVDRSGPCHPDLGEQEEVSEHRDGGPLGTGKAHGLLSPISCANFQDNIKAQSHRAPPRSRSDLHRPFRKPESVAPIPMQRRPSTRKKSILDYASANTLRSFSKLGTADRCDDASSTSTGFARSRWGSPQPASGGHAARCPTKVDTTGYNPGTGACGTMCAGADTGAILDVNDRQDDPQGRART